MEKQEERYERWKRCSALELAEKAGQYYDEHGHERGDYLSTDALDYVPPREAGGPPYHDSGGEGLALVEISRKRVYARSCRWCPTQTSTHYLIGRNEAGTYFAHPVPNHCNTVGEAVQWIWNGKAFQIVQRQGDIALIWGRGPQFPQLLPSLLPSGHQVGKNFISHAAHPSLPLPDKGQRIIVARRATARVSGATRD